MLPFLNWFYFFIIYFIFDIKSFILLNCGFSYAFDSDNTFEEEDVCDVVILSTTDSDVQTINRRKTKKAE